MNYINEKEFISNINADPSNKEFIHAIKGDVDSFFDTFNDNPRRMSKWAHHYFCREDGGLLIFDYNKPNEHKCSVCGKVYVDDELYNGVWTTMYRNLGATTAWKSAVVYRATNDKKYLENVLKFAEFYIENYCKFELHNKFGVCSESESKTDWGCARIMPQSLNECIFIIRLTNALELIKDELTDDFIHRLEDKFFAVAFEDIKTQLDAVHNIRCWFNSAIIIMGLFLGNNEMMSFGYMNEYNINRQLREGVTKDGFWYEGSIHYNFFMLEAVVNQLLFCKLYSCDYLPGEHIVENMLISAYNYAFDNHKFPNPNDGWPNINLKTYSYIYAMATKVYGKGSEIAGILSIILNGKGERGTLPLSRPYYYNNDLSLEEFLFAQGARKSNVSNKEMKPYNYDTSYCGMIRNDNINIFVKYGHNGPSHAHADKMNIEVMIKDKLLSRDLSNPGYGHPLCNEWHRKSVSHNTVVVDGKNHSNVQDGGICNSFTDTSFDVECKNVYKGVDYRRKVSLKDDGFSDAFSVNSLEEHTYDYIFHVEGTLKSNLELENHKLGFCDDGYQHIKDVKIVKVNSNKVKLMWDINGELTSCDIDLEGKELYIAQTPDNPVNNSRTTLIIRSKAKSATFNVEWKMED